MRFHDDASTYVYISFVMFSTFLYWTVQSVVCVIMLSINGQRVRRCVKVIAQDIFCFQFLITYTNMDIYTLSSLLSMTYFCLCFHSWDSLITYYKFYIHTLTRFCNYVQYFSVAFVLKILSLKPANLNPHRKKQDEAHEPEAHTYVNGTDVKTHGYAVTHNTFLQ